MHIYFLIGFANRLFVLLQWGLDFLTKRRRVRVLSEEPPSAQNLIDPAAFAKDAYSRQRVFRAGRVAMKLAGAAELCTEGQNLLF